MWVWPSMKPGETISPSASSVRAAAVATLPISLAWALAAAALPWLFLKGGHGS